MRSVTSRSEVLRLAWPIVLANSAVPLLGLADTAVIGHTGSVAGLGAIALGALIFSFVYWCFGFLRRVGRARHRAGPVAVAAHFSTRLAPPRL